MKKATIIFIFLLSALSQETKAQTYGVPDTLVYLQSIVANKAHFIGQPFSVLIDSLKIQIKYFGPNSGIVYDVSKETSTSFGFRTPQNAEEIYLTYPHLLVYWQPCLNANQSRILYNTTVGWTSTIAAFYATGIIADIQIRE